MDDLAGRVAVVTGAASGIGRGMAEAFADAGMHLVLADVEAERLQATETMLAERGVETCSMVVDVADAAAVEALAKLSYERFGAVNALCNNAGVVENNHPAWEYDLSDWDWVLGVNVMGVVHGIKSFIPRMLAQDAPAHVINTASVGGLVSGTATPIYIVSKHAVVALSECIYNSLRREAGDVRVSVLCPGWVATDIVDADRNREDAPPLDDAIRRSRDKFKAGVGGGIAPRAVGDLVVEALQDQRFYILTHPHWMPSIEERFDAIRDGREAALTRLPGA